jgi:hypothetical protein
MASVSESRAIRDGFGQFWRKKSGRQLPSTLKGITIANSTTFSTRVRVRLMKELARKHTIANPELTCFVTNYFPRPELKIRSRRSPMVTLSYTKAVLKMPHHLSNEFLVELYKYAKSVLPDEEIVERFLVLSPDLLNPNPGSELVDASAMSVDEQQAVEGQSEEVEEVASEADEHEKEAEPEQSTSQFKKVNKKSNKDRYFQDKKKNTPYSKPK